ncbi:dna polymerase type-x family member [Holotrichia oblita]|uniref:Dna polymerase type-x family member n=1 Tax=Holotrichia oblita TaxID=644536 RepID=A0ACB9T1L9_HOLOL|nr:dna polymerase type-x family member [Holotrichia oblita]
MSKRKKPSEDNPNSDFCEFLIELAEYEKNINRNLFKHKAYQKAANVLAAHPTRVKSGKEARRLDGIGEKIAKKIDEYLETGKLRKLENIHKDKKANVITLLTQVSGIGPAKAQNLADMGIETIEDLRKHTDKLTHHQIVGLKYFEDFQKKIPREEIEKIEEIIEDELRVLDADYHITICGSYRRGKLESGDIDVLITHPKYTAETHNKHNDRLKKIVNALEKSGLITDTLSLGETKFMGACRLKSGGITRRLDIRLTPFDQYYCSILYFTGSDMFNRSMRAHATEKGFILNEYSLRPLGSTGESQKFDFYSF